MVANPKARLERQRLKTFSLVPFPKNWVQVSTITTLYLGNGPIRAVISLQTYSRVHITFLYGCLTYFICEAKEVEDLLDLLKSLGKNGIPFCTPLARTPLLQVAVVVNSLQLVLGQLFAGTKSCHKVVEDVEILLSPVANTARQMLES